MSKLARENKFLDFSDYGRVIARVLAKSLLNTPVTPVHVTYGFLITGIAAIYCILNHYFIAATILLILKSIIDAADGELSRLRNSPSFIGRYLDSIFDLLLNLGILYSIYIISTSPFWIMVLAFIALQLQGTIYNYYYTILRNNLSGGDTTSRINENSFPKALHGESQKMVNFLYITFKVLYGGFDFIILNIDKEAQKLNKLPNWFMTFVSIYGLGFQLLLIGLLLILELNNYLFYILIFYSIFILVMIFIRKALIRKDN